MAGVTFLCTGEPIVLLAFLPTATIAGTGFGLAMAWTFAREQKRLNLPSWYEYPDLQQGDVFSEPL